MPCQVPWDIDIFEAVEPPADFCLPFNGIVFAGNWYGISRMAGGDYDGDLVSISFDATLMFFVKAIAKSINAVDIDALTNEVMKGLVKRKVDFKGSAANRRRDYCDSVLNCETPELRGTICAHAER